MLTALAAVAPPPVPSPLEERLQDLISFYESLTHNDKQTFILDRIKMSDIILPEQCLPWKPNFDRRLLVDNWWRVERHNFESMKRSALELVEKDLAPDNDELLEEPQEWEQWQHWIGGETLLQDRYIGHLLGLQTETHQSLMKETYPSTPETTDQEFNAWLTVWRGFVMEARGDNYAGRKKLLLDRLSDLRRHVPEEPDEELPIEEELTSMP